MQYTLFCRLQKGCLFDLCLGSSSWLMLHPLYPDIVSCTTSPISARQRLRAVANCNNQHLGSKILEIENEYHHLTLAATTKLLVSKVKVLLDIQNLKKTVVSLIPNRLAVTFVLRVLVFCICCSARVCDISCVPPLSPPASSHCPGARCAPGAGAGAELSPASPGSGVL